jgi:hypothetical protein
MNRYEPTPQPTQPALPEHAPPSLGVKALVMGAAAGVVGLQAYATYDLLTDGFMTPDSPVTKAVVALEVGGAGYILLKGIGHAISFRHGVNRAARLPQPSP